MSRSADDERAPAADAPPADAPVAQHPGLLRRWGISRTDVAQGLGALAVIVLLAGVPAAGGEDEERLVRSQAHVSRALATARELARTTGAAHAVAFDPPGDRLAVLDPRGEPVRDARGEPLVVSLDADLLDARFGAQGHTLVVAPGGWPLAGGTLVLRAGPHVLDLVLDEATGWIDAVLPGDAAAR